MSPVVNQLLSSGEVGHPGKTQERSYTESLGNDSQERIYSSSDETYSGFPMFDDFYATNEKAPTSSEAPVLPQRSALRASRLLDRLDLKLGAPIESAKVVPATPHDLYLSSEEDASSSADDFSDYGDDFEYELSSEGSQSPTSRTSYEVTARAVSVVFAGKPSIIDLPAPRRSINYGKRSSIYSTVSTIERASTPTESISSSLHQPTRTSNIVSSLLPSKRRPQFLNIDPYANGSTYSLDMLKEQNSAEASPRTPVTPTSLLKGATRTLSLVRKRSKPLLNNLVAATSRDQITTSPPRPLSRSAPRARQEEEDAAPKLPERPQSPITYGEIIKAARKNAMAAPPQVSPSRNASPHSPLASPTAPAANKRGILSGLAARRRSIKMTGGRMI